MRSSRCYGMPHQREGCGAEGVAIAGVSALQAERGVSMYTAPYPSFSSFARPFPFLPPSGGVILSLVVGGGSGVGIEVQKLHVIIHV